jgi:elongation factor Ts
MIQAGDVQKLREMTGAGIMDCKKALEEASGDFNKATELIKERGLAKAAKKADREASAGRIETYVHNDRVGVMLELQCETDFVARADMFKELAHDIAMQIAAMSPESVDDLMEQAFIKDGGETIESVVTEAIAKLGENIKIGRFVRYEI